MCVILKTFGHDCIFTPVQSVALCRAAQYIKKLHYPQFTAISEWCPLFRNPRENVKYHHFNENMSGFQSANRSMRQILRGLRPREGNTQLGVLDLFRSGSNSSGLRSTVTVKEVETEKGDQNWICGSSAAILETVRGHVEVRENFITEEEENALLEELEPGLKKKRYEFDHWDDAIHGYRETERLQWGSVCTGVLGRVRATAFLEGSPQLGPVHVLDLDKAGFIKPHVDSVKFCGSTIAGLSLLSDSVMRLVREENSADWVDLLLSRRSLYILRDEARFKFTHEILKDEESVFSGQRVPRHRRISVICRNLPV